MRIWKRLAAAVGVAALLAGGLVGVAGPAQANDPLYYAPVAGDKVCTDKMFNLSKKVPNSDPPIDDTLKVQAKADIVTFVKTSDRCQNEFTDAHGYCIDTYEPSGDMTYYHFYCYGYGQPKPAKDDQDGKPNGEEVVQKTSPPPPCWDPSLNNCPVGGALRFAAPKYAMVGVPVTMYAYASWRPDANSPAQPTNGTAVIRVDGEDYSGVELTGGMAEWTFIPKEAGEKNFTVSGVVSSGLSGANAYIDTVDASTYVVPYDPEFLKSALKGWRVDIGEKFVITDRDQALSHAKKRYKWSVAPKSEDVCAVYTTKKREVKAKFNDYGTCTVRWLDRKSAEEGKYTFIVTKPKLNIG